MQEPRHPTNKWADPDGMPPPPTWIERLAARRGLLIGLIAAGSLAVIASLILLWAVLAGPLKPSRIPAVAPTPPPLLLKPPPSLDELANQFPELADLLTDPSLGSVYKDFMLAYESGGPEEARRLAETRGLLNSRNEIRITLVVDDEAHVPALSEELRRVGITVEASYRERINIGVPLTLIEQLAEQQGIEALFQQLTQMEHIVRLELPLPKRTNRNARSAAQPQGTIQGEGVWVTGADAWHAAGITGQGVRVGVLDLGFDGYRELLGTELPEDTVVRSFVYGVEADQSGEVHGTACAEIVHEMAPDAELFLAYYDGTIATEGQAVEWLLDQGVQIISHSAGSILGPMNGTGDDAEMVDEVAARGVLWVNSAGNEAQNHYRGLYTDADGDGLHEFPNGAEEMRLWPYAGMTIVLNWDDWERVTEDYDLYLYDAGGDLVAAAKDTQDGSPGQIPAEGIILESIESNVYYLSIEGYRVTRPATFDLYVIGAEIEFPVPEHSLNTPADARGALTVGATEYRDDSLASYSSQGPSNDGRLKPELTAPAGVSGATYGANGFDGTSASTPHVAGAAALIWSAFPQFSREEVIAYLQANARDLGVSGPDSQFGYGRLQMPPPPQVAGVPAPTVAPLPTLQPIPTVVEGQPFPLPTVAVPPSSPGEATKGSALPVAVMLGGMGALGLCGAAIALGGAVLLLGAWRRTARPVPPSPVPTPSVAGYAGAPLPSAEAGYGALVGPGIGTITLKPGALTIGRDASCDIVLPSRLVSRRHARIECSVGSCRVVDLQSSNGTFVNDRRVSQATLNAGDRLRIGDVELVYQGPSRVPMERAAPPAFSEAWLEIEGVRHPIPNEGLSIGRSAENDLRIPDGTISRQHARIERRGDTFVVVDLNSANGTFVNGQRVQQHLLQDGDEIRVGQVRMRFRLTTQQPHTDN